MNKQFFKKMIKAKKLECEAIMEIMPSGMKRKIEKLEREAVNLGKEIILELIKEDDYMKTKNYESNENLKKNVKKVKVEF